MTVDPANSNVVYLGGTTQPTKNTVTYVLTANVASGNTIKVDRVSGMTNGDTLVIDSGGAKQESVKVAGTTAGASAIVRNAGTAGAA
jgi:hypothetical protein